MSTEIATISPSANAWELVQRQAKAMASSSLVPKDYQGNIPNCIIAIELAGRIGASPLLVAQNLHVIQGRPSWSATFLIAALNSSGKFSPLRFEMTGTGKDLACHAWALDKATGDRLEGPTVTMAMANEEGWSTKGGSKWKTMPELMIRYRAAAFFSRLYAPEITMGMHTVEEVEDVQPTVRLSSVAQLVNESIITPEEREALNSEIDVEQKEGPF